jgi:hypothetical protein
MSTWYVITIRKLGDRFHQSFIVSLKVHPLLYKDMNVAISTTQK